MISSTPVLGDTVLDTLSQAMLQAVDHAIEFDFGAGGNANSTPGDRLYVLDLDLDGHGLFETTRSFHRLPCDVNGDGKLDPPDSLLVNRSKGRHLPPAS